MNRTKKITQKFMSKTRKANAKLNGRRKTPYIAKAGRVAMDVNAEPVEVCLDDGSA
ncbi:DUF2986 domain-containing protein [Shewanella surugensis]|uniref:DUF2986 domain-containing protein n=1 Tax=Shewanella surugensis TaxID=212020 RepID=A0ABT0L9P6_9GAMM|nr:DUF2986 domain-containing protein [Shewanella surugensis]MCL1124409.1 DUF2986 domain-containing protein [Shewanella surugensis]